MDWLFSKASITIFSIYMWTLLHFSVTMFRQPVPQHPPVVQRREHLSVYTGIGKSIPNGFSTHCPTSFRHQQSTIVSRCLKNSKLVYGDADAGCLHFSMGTRQVQHFDNINKYSCLWLSWISLYSGTFFLESVTIYPKVKYEWIVYMPSSWQVVTTRCGGFTNATGRPTG
jgi:hypothetical protein